MRTVFLVLVLLAVSGWSISAWGACPADTIDRGECDTIYIEPWHADTILQGGTPYFVKVPIYVTHDVTDSWDSIAAFVIPLCYTHTNPEAYCSTSAYWNSTAMLTIDPKIDRSVFRHLPSMDDPQVHNRMLDMNADYMSGWDAVFVNVYDDSQFWFEAVPTGTPDQRWGGGSRILLATMTFNVEEAMEICIDTCFWPPESHLAFVTTSPEGGYAYSYVPRFGSENPESYQTCFALRFLCGDANTDGEVSIADVVYLLNYLFRNGPAPDPLELGDENGDGAVSLEDAIYLLNYLFKGGPPPCPDNP
jgi:hypothetical protein